MAVSGLHRKHAMRLLRGGPPSRQSGLRLGRRVYDVAVREALIVVWEASDRVCGKRLRPLVPLLIEAMERHGHLQLAPEVRGGLVSMSAATIDRALHEIREQRGARHHPKPGPGQRIDPLGVKVRPIQPADKAPHLLKRPLERSAGAMFRTHSSPTRFYGASPNRRYTALNENEGFVSAHTRFTLSARTNHPTRLCLPASVRNHWK